MQLRLLTGWVPLTPWKVEQLNRIVYFLLSMLLLRRIVALVTQMVSLSELFIDGKHLQQRASLCRARHLRRACMRGLCGQLFKRTHTDLAPLYSQRHAFVSSSAA